MEPIRCRVKGCRGYGCVIFIFRPALIPRRGGTILRPMLHAPSSPPAQPGSAGGPADPGQVLPRRLGGILLLAGTLGVASLAALAAAMLGPLVGLVGMLR